MLLVMMVGIFGRKAAPFTTIKQGPVLGSLPKGALAHAKAASRPSLGGTVQSTVFYSARDFDLS